MSRIGRMPIPVPSGVEVEIDGSDVRVKGPKGTLSHTLAEPIVAERLEDGQVQVTRPDDENRSRALHGLSRTLVANMVTGVTDGYTKTLEIVGVGYRVQARGSDLEFALGFSHPVHVIAARRHHVRGRDADPLHGQRHRQAAGGRDRREDPQAAQARPVQGQGRAVPRRAHPPQGRKGWEVSHGAHAEEARLRARRRHARAATSGSARRSPARPTGRGWW